MWFCWLLALYIFTMCYYCSSRFDVVFDYLFLVVILHIFFIARWKMLLTRRQKKQQVTKINWLCWRRWWSDLIIFFLFFRSFLVHCFINDCMLSSGKSESTCTSGVVDTGTWNGEVKVQNKDQNSISCHFIGCFSVCNAFDSRSLLHLNICTTIFDVQLKGIFSSWASCVLQLITFFFSKKNDYQTLIF